MREFGELLELRFDVEVRRLEVHDDPLDVPIDPRDGEQLFLRFGESRYLQRISEVSSDFDDIIFATIINKREMNRNSQSQSQSHTYIHMKKE